MESVFAFIVGTLLFLTGSSAGALEPVQSAVLEPASVELGLSEPSPRGAEGGWAVPASGCSVAESHGEAIHDCGIPPDISVDSPIVRLGDDVEVFWDPRVHQNCVLSNNVNVLTTYPNSAAQPDANSVGSRIDTPTGETSYSIVCDGYGNEDTATVKVLPRFQET